MLQNDQLGTFDLVLFDAIVSYLCKKQLNVNIKYRPLAPYKAQYGLPKIFGIG